MHNIWVRLNAVVFFGLTVLLVCAVLCSFSTYFHNAKPIIKTLKMVTLTKLAKQSGREIAMFTFDLHADLRPAFHWNLKQLFVFVVAEYESKANVLNQVIVWDKIVNSTDNQLLDLKEAKVKYLLQDQGLALRNNSISLRLMWDAMPWTGRIYVDDKRKDSFTLPGSYVGPERRLR